MDNPQLILADTPDGFEVRLVDTGINLVQRVFGPASEVECEQYVLDVLYA